MSFIGNVTRRLALVAFISLGSAPLASQTYVTRPGPNGTVLYYGQNGAFLGHSTPGPNGAKFFYAPPDSPSFGVPAPEPRYHYTPSPRSQVPIPSPGQAFMEGFLAGESLRR
jgi:hypothetical protein